MKNKELILIDASWVVHRMWHVHSNLSVTLHSGEELKTGHIYGFARLLKTLNEHYPDADVIVCLDGKATHGKELNGDYKGNRQNGSKMTAFDDLGVLVECAVVFNNVVVAFHRNLEADEIISYFCDLKSGAYEKIIVYSADGDMTQLLSKNVFIAKEFDKGLLKLIDENFYYTDEKYVDKFCGCKIAKLPLYRAMVGDSSDNLPGFPRLRKKLAKEFAEKYGSVEAIVQAVNAGESFPEGFKDFLPVLQNNYEIMKLPTANDLNLRGVKPHVFNLVNMDDAKMFFSLYRIKSVSPVDTVVLNEEEELMAMEARADVNSVWKHPNSNK